MNNVEFNNVYNKYSSEGIYVKKGGNGNKYVYIYNIYIFNILY